MRGVALQDRLVVARLLVVGRQCLNNTIRGVSAPTGPDRLAAKQEVFGLSSVCADTMHKFRALFSLVRVTITTMDIATRRCPTHGYHRPQWQATMGKRVKTSYKAWMGIRPVKLFRAALVGHV